MLHMALEKCIKQIDASFLVFTKFYHVKSTGTVKVFALCLDGDISSLQCYTVLTNIFENMECYIPLDSE